jgi:penicillin-binding protein 2
MEEAFFHPAELTVFVDDVSYEHAIRFLAYSPTLPGVRVEAVTTRKYVTDALPTLSHVLGYVGKISEEELKDKQGEYRRIDVSGKTGVELTYESALRGNFGRKVVETNALGVEQRIVAEEPPRPGSNLILSIDASLTRAIEGFLTERLSPSAKAAIIVANPWSGELFALVSLPGYDANAFSRGIDKHLYETILKNPSIPLFPRAIAGEYPPGSTFKSTVAAAALTEGIINRETSFLSNGGISVGPWFFPDWKAGGHGAVNVIQAIADSVNTFFYTVGGGYENVLGLGLEKMMDYAGRFGFGLPTGLDIPGEGDGFLPTEEWKERVKGERWYIGDTYHAAIGQGDILVTPLQIAMQTVALANGGTAYAPRVVHAVETEGIVQEFKAVSTPLQVVTKEAIEIVREGLHEAVLSGSAWGLTTLPFSSAGKTGTAQWSSVHEPHAWFTGFAPFENPEIVVTVFVEEGGEGSAVAVPIARDIFSWWFTNTPRRQ